MATAQWTTTSTTTATARQATGNNDDDHNDAMDDNVDDDGDGTTDDDFKDDNADRTKDNNRTMDNNVDNHGYGTMDDDIGNDCDGATDSCHCLNACGGCTTKGDVRRRHATTGTVTTSLQTRCKWEERRQQTRGNRALIGRGCALRGGGRVKRMRGRGISLLTRNRSPYWRSRRPMQQTGATTRWLMQRITLLGDC